ncbi:MAG: hypothetical protein KC635_19195 [Myxococcales bacterium]|nr:hypothetical protein [Myxococcales bacterium]
MDYVAGAAHLSPVQLTPGGGDPGDLAATRARTDECAALSAGVVEEEALEASMRCLAGVGADVSDAIFDPALEPGRRAALRELLAEIDRRIAVAERAREAWRERGGPEAGAATRIMALVFGESTVGMHLRPRAREGIHGMNAGRLAAATAAHGAMKVIDRWALRGFASEALDDLFEAARRIPDEPTPTSGGLSRERSINAPAPAHEDVAAVPEEGEGGTTRDEPRDGVIVFPKQAMTPVSVATTSRAQVFQKTIGVGPLSVTVDVAAVAQVLGHVTAEIGEGRLTEIAMGAGDRGTASLHVPAHVGAALDVTGRLEIDGRLFDVFPAASLSGSLTGSASARGEGESVVQVSVRRTARGDFELEGSGAFGAELVGDVDLNAELALELMTKRLWSAEWQVASAPWHGPAVAGTWRCVVGEGKPSVAIVPETPDLDADRLIDDAFMAAAVSQVDGQDNPWKCRAEGKDIVGDFADFPWGGAAGAPPYPTAAVADHPANRFYRYVTGTAVPRPSGPYRVKHMDRTPGAPDKSDAWRRFLDRRLAEEKEDLRATHPDWSPSQVDRAGKRELEEEYEMGWVELYLVNNTWQCHHIHEFSWGGHATAPSNLKYLKHPESHQPYTDFGNRHRAAMRSHLGVKL